MGRGEEKFARVESVNTASFSFPYKGDQHLRLILRKSARFGNDVILKIEHGQFMSSYSQNFVTAKFDRGELQKFMVGDSADNDGGILFIRHYDRFVGQLRKAKRLKIVADFYHEGSRVFEFDVHGLKTNW